MFSIQNRFQIEINFQLRDLPPLTLLFIGGRLYERKTRLTQKDNTYLTDGTTKVDHSTEPH